MAKILIGNEEVVKEHLMDNPIHILVAWYQEEGNLPNS